MADEEKKEGTTSDDALSKAQDEATPKATEEETPAEVTEEPKEVVVEEKPWEADIHKLKSQLGRERKQHEDEMSDIKKKMDYTTYHAQPQTPLEERYISNEADLEKWYQNKKDTEAKVQSDYEDKYKKYLDRIAVEEELEDDEVKEVGKLLSQSEYNVAFSGYKDPVSDADRNFNRALARVRKSTKPTPNLKGDTPRGTGVNVNTQMQEKDSPVPKLDNYAEEYAKKMGMKPETIKKALNGEMPMRLKR